jgi:hypothetical protein
VAVVLHSNGFYEIYKDQNNKIHEQKVSYGPASQVVGSTLEHPNSANTVITEPIEIKTRLIFNNINP